MPIYEYECAGCGHRLEAIQSFSDAPLRKCPDCGRARLKKLISAVGFRLSGKGWYETDFKNNKQKNLTQKDSAEEKKSAKSGDAGAEKKSSKSGDAGAEKNTGTSANGDAKKTTESSSAKSKSGAAPPAAGN